MCRVAPRRGRIASPWPMAAGLALLALAGCGSSAEKPGVNHLIAASTAISNGDKETAITELGASIDEAPNTWAYFQRAQIYVSQGKFDEAAADCQAGLDVDSTDVDLNWLQTELKKPPQQRFKGRFAKPPSQSGRR